MPRYLMPREVTLARPMQNTPVGKISLYDFPSRVGVGEKFSFRFQIRNEGADGGCLIAVCNDASSPGTLTLWWGWYWQDTEMEPGGGCVAYTPVLKSGETYEESPEEMMLNAEGTYSITLVAGHLEDGDIVIDDYVTVNVVAGVGEPRAKVNGIDLPEELAPGEAVYGTITVRNVGDAADYLGVRVKRTDTGDEKFWVSESPVSPDSTITVDVRDAGWTMPDRDLTLEIGAGVAPGGDLDKYTETDSTTRTIEKKPVEEPDLKVMSSAFPLDAKVGEYYDAMVRVENFGGFAEKAVILVCNSEESPGSMKIDGDWGEIEVPPGWCAIWEKEDVAKGDSWRIDYKVMFLEGGTYKVEVNTGWVDAEGNIHTTDSVEHTTSVSAPEAEAKINGVDLPEEASPGETITGSLTIRNVGDAPGSFGAIVYFEELNKTLYAEPPAMLNPGETKTYSLTAEAGIVMPDSDLHWRIEAGTVTDPLYSDFVKQDEKTGVIRKKAISPEKGVIAGKIMRRLWVVDQPAAGARVEADGYSTRADEEGVYRLEVKPGSYEVVVDLGFPFKRESKKVEVKEGETVTADFTVELNDAVKYGVPILGIVGVIGAVAPRGKEVIVVGKS